MTTTDQIVKTAENLGKMISEHQAAKKHAEAQEKLADDIETQRLINDLERYAQSLAEKQSQGKPIEVEDKHKLKELQDAMAGNKVVRELQTAQMNYLDLMRLVNNVIAQACGLGEAAQKPSAVS